MCSNEVTAKNEGFMVAGQGMSGCMNYGFPIVDTTSGSKLVYLDTSSTAKFDTAINCIKKSGFAGCTNLTTPWL